MKLLEETKRLGFKIKDNIACINVDGFDYFYYAYKKKEYLYVCLNKSLISRYDLRLLNNNCGKSAKITCDNLIFKDDILFIKVNDKYDLISILKAISETLTSLKYKSRCNCIICGENCEYNKYQNYLLPIDKNCIDKFDKKQNEYISNKKENLKKSIILSFIVGLIGLIPSLIVAFIFSHYNYVSSILLFPISFFATLAFYKTNLYRTYKTDIIASLIPIIYIVIYHVILVVLCINYYDINTVSEYFVMLKDYIVEVIFTTLFSYIGGFFSALQLCKKKILLSLRKKA